MPFTPTHLAAIVPIAWWIRLPLPFSALAIGTLIPDLPAYLAVGPDYGTTHSAAGVLIACLPLGLGAFVVFQLTKQPLAELVPTRLRSRLVPLDEPLRPAAAVVAGAAVAVLLGAATHVLWDSFTHAGGWGVRLLPILDGHAATIGGRRLRWYDMAQHGSSVVLLPLLAIGLAVWLAGRDALSVADRYLLPRRARAAALAVVVSGAALAGLLAAGLALPGRDGGLDVDAAIAGLKQWSFGTGALGVAVYSAGFAAYRRRRPTAADG